jgi:hypothetical protein
MGTGNGELMAGWGGGGGRILIPEVWSPSSGRGSGAEEAKICPVTLVIFGLFAAKQKKLDFQNHPRLSLSAFTASSTTGKTASITSSVSL